MNSERRFADPITVDGWLDRVVQALKECGPVFAYNHLDADPVVAAWEAAKSLRETLQKARENAKDISPDAMRERPEITAALQALPEKTDTMMDLLHVVIAQAKAAQAETFDTADYLPGVEQETKGRMHTYRVIDPGHAGAVQAAAETLKSGHDLIVTVNKLESAIDGGIIWQEGGTTKRQRGLGDLAGEIKREAARLQGRNID